MCYHRDAAMGPLIDAELERTDRRHAQLTRLSHELVGLHLLSENASSCETRTNFLPRLMPYLCITT